MNMRIRRVARAMALMQGSLLVVGCSAILDLRDDYELATDAGNSGQVDGGRDARNDVTTPAHDAPGHDAPIDHASSRDVVAEGAPPDGSPPPDASPEAGADAGSILSPTLVAPITTATTSIQTPTLHWKLPAGVTEAQVEICTDRLCHTIKQAVAAVGSSVKVSTSLAPGLYYWRVHGRVGSTIGTAVSATWELWVRRTSGVSNEIDSSFSAFPDFDGDGRGDILTGNGGGNESLVYLGGTGGPTTASGFQVTNSKASIVFAPSTFGDIDGDGFSDVVIAVAGQPFDAGPTSPNNNIAIFRGGSGFGPSFVATPTWTIQAPLVPGEAGVGPQFGTALGVPGDVNGDGYEDILVGTQGPAYIYFGHPGGPSSTPDIVLHSPTEQFPLANFTRIGDVDGDGYADVLMSNGLGQLACLYFGGPDGPSDQARRTLNTPTSPGEFGFAIMQGAGDVDGDGYPDFIVGDPFSHADDGGFTPGRAYVFRGQPRGPSLSNPATTLIGVDVQGAFGSGGAIVGDVNDDGFDDVVIGAPRPPNNTYAGHAFFYPGKAGGLAGSASNMLIASGGYFGSAAAGGDVDGDGYLDALIAAPLEPIIYVFPGGATPLVAKPDASATISVTPFGFLYFFTQASPPKRSVRGG